VPDLASLVKLGFDVAELRSATLVSYANRDNGEERSIHVWRRRSKRWETHSLDDLASGSCLPVPPSNIYLVGSGVQRTLAASVAQLGDVTHIESHDVVRVVRQFDETMDFTGEEWRALAQRHSLRLVDLNETRRKWGRYGPPKEPTVHSGD